MKLLSCLCLFTLILADIEPFRLAVPISPCNGEAAILALDVCHSHGTTLTGSTELPSLFESTCEPLGLELSGFYEGTPADLNRFIIVFQIERPPRS